ncbi:hypothetical protein TSUD_32700 [Trifolium subterraneum]|uniref:F-box domain-containing protein n=1 Tax=Trifolium subterraneum TaxID=3900 RepID=A0A2Z6MR05_TRISU|nr:hypothetical protein TSUD_32700 [Trifolium subterraneum]
MRPMIDETSAVNYVPTLPYDLVEEEILSRLPVKFLLQIRCVCKSWNSLISDPRFAKKHLSMSTMLRFHFVRCSSLLGRNTVASCPPQCIFTTDVTQLEYPSYNFDYPRRHVIVGSCNGILCLANVLFVDDSYVVILWNPSLRKVKELPQPRYPNLSSISYAFGYDIVRDNYKVVAVLWYNVYDNSGDLLEKAVVMINTLGTNFWKNTKEFPFNSRIVHNESGIFVSGTIN